MQKDIYICLPKKGFVKSMSGAWNIFLVTKPITQQTIGYCLIQAMTLLQARE